MGQLLSTENPSRIHPMLFIIFLLLSVGNNGNQALPILWRAEPSMTTPGSLAQRSLFTIIWGCFSTIFVCAWVSVHPNIPPPRQCGWKSLGRRFGLMFWMLVAPELILAWAVRQWFAAKKIADVYNEARCKGIQKPRNFAKIAAFIRQWFAGQKDTGAVRALWTRAHGHFISMGGVILVEPSPGAMGTTAANQVLHSPSEKVLVSTHEYGPSFKQPESEDLTYRILSLELFQQLVKRPDFHISITEEEIRDKSKRDFLSKLIVIIQSSWFIAQCIARGIQGLNLTELELVTLALASLNAVMYFFWWDKPLDVMVPIKVHLPFRLDDPAQNDENNNVQQDSLSQAESTLTFLSPGEVLSRASVVSDRLKGLILDILRNPFEGGFFKSLYRWLILLPSYMVAFVSFPFFFPFPFVIVFLIRIITPKQKPASSSDSRGVLLKQILIDLRTTRYQLTSFVDNVFDAWLNSISNMQGSLSSFLFGWFFVLPMFVLLIAVLCLLVPVFAFFFLIFFIFTTIFSIFDSSTIHPDDKYVHRFYAPKTDSDRYSRMVVFALFGVIFGGLHCLGWYFTYPSQAEERLWRVSALTITVIPIVVAPIDFITNPSDNTGTTDSSNRIEDNFSVTNHGPASFIFSMDHGWKKRLVKKVLIYVLDFIMTMLLFVYVLARLSLIVQALALLRRQPASSFLEVDWTKFIPHV